MPRPAPNKIEIAMLIELGETCDIHSPRLIGSYLERNCKVTEAGTLNQLSRTATSTTPSTAAAAATTTAMTLMMKLDKP